MTGASTPVPSIQLSEQGPRAPRTAVFNVEWVQFPKNICVLNTSLRCRGLGQVLPHNKCQHTRPRPPQERLPHPKPGLCQASVTQPAACGSPADCMTLITLRTLTAKAVASPEVPGTSLLPRASTSFHSLSHLLFSVLSFSHDLLTKPLLNPAPNQPVGN